MSPQAPAAETLPLLLKNLKLPHILQTWQSFEQQAITHQWSYTQFLLTLCEYESTQRYQLRVQRVLKETQLPSCKALANFDFSRCSTFNQPTVMQLAQDTGWLKRGENLLIFGPSGVGKTHLSAAIARSLVELGAKVKFISATALVQHLQQAKLQLQFQSALLKLDKYDLLIIDDIGYVRNSEAETSVLFELIAHRYEIKSLLITSNHPFSAWDEIFPDSTMTVAAVDRLVHHAVILEIQAESFRKQAALQQSFSRGFKRST
jgi:DNA replication protein DnaC